MINKKFSLSILIRTLVVSLVLGFSCSISHADSALFTFDTDTVGTNTPFTDTNNGVSATFSSSGDPGGFTITTSFFQSLTGNVLYDPGPAGLSNLDLNITFSQPVIFVSLDFALDTSDTTVPLVIQEGAYSSSATGVIPAGYTFPEGSLSSYFYPGFTGPFILSTTALNFAVDNVYVETAAVPEPTTMFLLGSGLIGLSGYGRKKFFGK